MALPKFFHFIIDDIFIPDSIKCFTDACITDNMFFFITNEENYKLKFFDKRIKLINLSDAQKVIETAGSCDVLVLHSLYSMPLNIISRIDPSIKVVWYAWGYDLYNNPLPGWHLIKIKQELLPETRGLAKKIFFRDNLLKYTKHYIKKITYSDYSSEHLKNAIARIDYFAGVFSEEYDMLKERYPYFKAIRLTHNYIHPEEFKQTDISANIEITGNNILLGNSAVYLGNHLDVLRILREKIDSKNTSFKIICPLSYAGLPRYIASVKKEGLRLFGDHFVALTDFLPFDEYQKIVKSCNTIILGQIRQAATCNCLSSVWSGLRLFVHNESMNYGHYKNEGITVYNFDEFTIDLTQNQRSMDEVIADRIRIEELYSYRQWVLDLENSLKIMGI